MTGCPEMPLIFPLNSIRPSTHWLGGRETYSSTSNTIISKRLKKITPASIMLLQRLLVAVVIFGALGFSANAIAPPKIRADQSPAVAVTNAERFALGLPPLPPRRPATPRQVAPRSGSSPVPLITYTCLIGVRQTSNNQFMGHLTPATSRNAIRLQTSAVNALVSTFKIPIGATSQSGMLVYDTSNGLVLAGLSTSSTNPLMWPTLYNYVTLSSLEPPSDTPPSYTNGYFESAIWSYDVATQILTPQWVNPVNAPIAVINLNADVLSLNGDHVSITKSEGVDASLHVSQVLSD
ncbi:hypothetical protein R3P38DRAFT_2914620 [Favolaschia claudopus]|uniref:Uncharacterized protein n=1 Tax=Favolaschia claudopus TaxID=2862362 RepID=A0AAW0C2K3_9AGAR